MRSNKEYDISREMMESIKESEHLKRRRRYLREEEEKDGEKKEKKSAIAITNDPKFGDNVLQNQIDGFRHAVNGGAKFGKENAEDAESNPLIYYPNDGNVVFSGSIPSLSGLKFQFSLNDTTQSPYIFVDGLALTEDAITTLNKLRGYYKNFCDQFNAVGDLLDKLKEGDF